MDKTTKVGSRVYELLLKQLNIYHSKNVDTAKIRLIRAISAFDEASKMLCLLSELGVDTRGVTYDDLQTTLWEAQPGCPCVVSSNPNGHSYPLDTLLVMFESPYALKPSGVTGNCLPISPRFSDNKVKVPTLEEFDRLFAEFPVSANWLQAIEELFVAKYAIDPFLPTAPL